jgi:hypothetical protein
VPASRGEAAAQLREVLAAACSASEVCLIGSLAEPESVDDFRDIDIPWTIPPGQAADPLQSLRLTLERVGKVESQRVNP